MAGHSKWANIKHRKAAQDAKRGKIFTKLIREIVVAARNGGPAPEDNPALRSVMDKALTANMKKDTIEKAIARGAGSGEGDDYEVMTYEGYGANGVAFYVKCLSDNRNRTVSEVRHAFTKCGGNLGTDGSVAYLFSNAGQLFIEHGDENAIMEVALEAGAEDVISNDDGSFEIRTAPEDFLDVKEALVGAGYEVEGEVTMIPSTETELDEENAEKIQRLIDMLEDLDDVQAVYTNAAFPETETS
ncbi:YebC/PmpR family DNA-binding transcriptional regulator [Saccharospirillum salsuginis]|uniref:Probable transcriptional regulatory protein GCM10007392_32570 n=1 Tax=Saccharospirillum salsuginis TaxID=418750 RepID=A0A918KFR3_9GAMM|nr:YebC/PmpR family DNA-binding transcriptional regulator [Saccharospirillum salsuginis]GGX62192.1 transcriptional regulatory protein PmpR [Saccharospirillum salsuginis]